MTDLFLRAAIEEARQGLSEGGIPIGSVLVIDGRIVGRGHNRRVQKGSAIRHAEMDCLENAGRLQARDYQRATLYSTLSPCDMCSGAALLYKIPRIVIGENTTFRGPEEYVRSRGVTLTIADDAECRALMREFIGSRPDLWNEDIGFDADFDPATGMYMGTSAHAARSRDWSERVRVVEGIIRKWDPLGLRPGAVVPANEYDRYAPPIVSMVLAGASIDALARHLAAIATDSTGSGAVESRDHEVAREIIAAVRKES